MSAFTVKGIDTIVLHVKDPAESAVFYEQTLDFKKTEEFEGMIWFSVGEGDQAVPFMLHPGEIPEPAASGIGLTLAVDDAEGLVSAVKASETGKIVQEPADREWGVREAVIEDPDGYHIWFVQKLK